MLKRLNVREKIWATLALFVLGMLALSAVNLYTTRDILMSEKKLKTRHLVEAAHSVAAGFEAQQLAGKLSESAAKEAALRVINTMRYQGVEYFWVNDLSLPVPRMVMHSTLPELNGRILDAEEFNAASSQQVGIDGPVTTTDGKKNLFVAFNEVVQQGGDGYVTYLWPKPLLGGGVTTARFPKLSYIKKLDGWGWVIGSGIYIDDVDQLIHDRMLKDLSIILGISGSLALLGALLVAGITRRLIHGSRALIAMKEGKQPLAPLPVGQADEIGTLISGFNQLQAALLEKEGSLRLSASVFENAGEGIVITDPRGSILSVNPSFTKLTGYTAEEAIGKNPSMLQSGRQDSEFYKQLWQKLISEGYWRGEVWNRRKNGEIYAEMLAITAVRDDQGQLCHYVGIFSDITSAKEQQKRLQHMAHFDGLTQLPNRVLLADRLQLALIHAQRTQDLIAVAFLDLDEFKPVNDRLGHDAGDKLLIEVAQRLLRCIRGGDTVARLGGDEFVLLLVGLKDIQEARHALERVISMLAAPFLLKGELVSISASIGVTLSPLDGADGEVLLRHADQAMYEAKQSGRNCYRFFDVEHDRNTRAHSARLSDIRLALTNNEFVLFYQPKVDLRLGRVVGAEALIRWRHPERGLLQPETFLPTIDSHELEIAIGDWVIDTALAQMDSWHQMGLHLPVSVNASASQLEANDFLKKLAAAVARHPTLPRFSLEIEILETTALSDFENISQLIDACIKLGVDFALDDFGTGYSSLTYVKRLPAHILKIDKSFVIEMLEQPDDLAIVEGVIGFTQAFQREVIAEGVESAEHGAMLLHLGCELAQGYGIARPMPADAMPGWIAAYHPDPLWGNIPKHNRANFPLLRAEADHRLWVERLEAIVTEGKQGNRKPPPLNPHHCAFGRWLDGPGRDLYGELPQFGKIDLVHREVHKLGEKIIELKNSASTETIQPALAELRELHRSLVADLHNLREIASKQ
jgi:diguanylate cyclase (GGDEF)-like protein/PAS domain S-box-containing protein